MSSDFNLTSELVNNTLVFKTEGYINNVAGERMIEEFSKHIDSGISKLIMDFKNSKVVNSIGISYLIEILEQVSQSNGKLFFTNLDPTIEKTFSLMGLFQFAEKADSVESALKN